jgi:glutamyl/glutaminyl-tRNA synthetase
MLSPDILEQKVFSYLPTELKNKKIVPLIIERISKFGDIKEMVEKGELEYFYKRPHVEKDKLLFKNSSSETILKNLKEAIDVLKNIVEEDFNKENIKLNLMKLADKTEKSGEVLHPIRMALSGMDKSPDPFILAEILGKEETITRLSNSVIILNE